VSKLITIDGLKVFDAKKPVRLIVTEDDCRRANRKKPKSCAVARACGRVAEEARVHLSRLYLRINGQWQRYETPKAMRDEIIAFDRGGAFEPQEFRLKPPRPSRRLGQHTGGQHRLRKNAKRRRKPHVVTNVRMGPM